MATDDDAATLRERVRELEQTVAQQQDTIQQLMPSRRAILAGGAGLVGGAALTGQASAQSAAGQVGTSSEPVDVEAFDVTVQNGLDMADNTISNVNGLTASSAVIGGTVTATDVNTDSVTTDSASVTNQVDAGSVNTGDLDVGSSDLVSTGDFLAVGPNYNSDSTSFTTSQTSYVTVTNLPVLRFVWDDWLPSNATGGFYSYVGVGGGSTKDLRLQNTEDGETVWEVTGLVSGTEVSRVDEYTPTTTTSDITLELQMRTGGSSGECFTSTLNAGVSL
jgi:hypothetical protein